MYDSPHIATFRTFSNTRMASPHQLSSSCSSPNVLHFCKPIKSSTNLIMTNFHRENGGTLGMVPLIINPIYTLYSGHLLGIQYPLLKGSKQGNSVRVPPFPYETTNPSKSSLFTRPHGGHWTTTQLLQHLIMIMCVNEGFGRFLKKECQQ